MVRGAGRARSEPADRKPDPGGRLHRADRPGAATVTELAPPTPESRPGWPPPAPGAAPLSKRVVAQAGLEFRTLIRNGEQLLLTLVIPVLLLVVFSAEALINIGPGSRINFIAPGILALAVMSTSFTSLAIGTSFERRYGVLKRLGSTPLSRGGLVAAKAVTVLAVE